MSVARVWLVLSPPYTYTDVIDYWIGGPTYVERDVLYVYCRTRQRAKVLALRKWRREHPTRDYLYPGENPWNGMTAQRPQLVRREVT